MAWLGGLRLRQMIRSSSIQFDHIGTLMGLSARPTRLVGETQFPGICNGPSMEILAMN